MTNLQCPQCAAPLERKDYCLYCKSLLRTRELRVINVAPLVPAMQQKLEKEIRKWQQDPNHIGIVPKAMIEEK